MSTYVPERVRRSSDWLKSYRKGGHLLVQWDDALAPEFDVPTADIFIAPPRPLRGRDRLSFENSGLVEIPTIALPHPLKPQGRVSSESSEFTETPETRRTKAPTRAELLARGVMNGAPDLTSEARDRVVSGKGVPLLFALRELSKSELNNENVGLFARDTLKALISETTGSPATLGHLLVLVAMHRPAALSGLVREAFLETRPAGTAMEILLGLRALIAGT